MERRRQMTKLWGVHNDTLTVELFQEDFVSIGWDELGDLMKIPNGREGLKGALNAALPDKKARAIAGWAGVISRFRDEIQIGDIVVAPYKPDSTISIGKVTGDYYYEAAAETHRHRRPVTWLKEGLSRTVFSQAALYELGAFLTVFRLRKHTDEFLAALSADAEDPEAVERVVEDSTPALDDDGSTDVPRASRIDRHTRDYVLEALHRSMTHLEFEEFTADLLRALGYQARVTQYQQDGGVDVIAHRDPLGVEPPLMKVHCKHRTSTTGAPEVQQLVGTQGAGELSLFVTLGIYSRDAVAIERQRAGLRLIDGETLVSLVLEHYDQMPERWRSRIRLTPVLVVADSADQ